MKWTPDESSSKYEESAVLRPGAIDFVRKCILRVCSSFFCWLPAQGVFRCPFKLNDLDVLPVNHIHTHAQTPSVSIIRRVHTFLPIDVYKYAHKKYRVQRKKLTLRRNRYYKYVSILPIINAVYCSSVVRMTGWEQMNGKTVRNRSKRIPLMFLKTMFSIVGGTYRERERESVSFQMYRCCLSSEPLHVRRCLHILVTFTIFTSFDVAFLIFTTVTYVHIYV